MFIRDVMKQLRERAGLTQEALARGAGMSLGNVRNYEQGIRLPTFPAIVKLAAVLGVDCTAFSKCDDVVGESKPEKPAPKKKGGKK